GHATTFPLASVDLPATSISYHILKVGFRVRLNPDDRPAAPMGMTIWAIHDVGGCVVPFEEICNGCHTRWTPSGLPGSSQGGSWLATVHPVPLADVGAVKSWVVKLV